MATTARGFVLQLSALGFLARIVQILAILSLLSLNDYFTTSSQILSLLPIGILILLLLILVATADSISLQIGRKLAERLSRINATYGSACLPSVQNGSFSQQLYYFRTVFLPVLTAATPAPLLIIVLAFNTPYLFIVSIVQSLSNALLVYYYNRQLTSSIHARPSDVDADLTGLDTNKNYILRHGKVGQSKHLRGGYSEKDSPGQDFAFARKKDALRTSNLVFRGIILILSAILAIYKLSSLTSVIGFFILNNTLRYAVIVLAEYCWPACRYLTLKESFNLLAIALEDENTLLRQIENLQHAQYHKWLRFDLRMSGPIQLKPYLRFKDLKLNQTRPTHRNLLKGITGRFELLPINLIYIKGVNLVNSISSFCSDQQLDSLEGHIQGIAVCGQIKIDSFFWRHLPIANPKMNRIISPRLTDHFDQSHHSRLLELINVYNLESLYLQDDLPSIATSHLSRHQILRMRALITLLDTIVNPHSLWLLPFVLDIFEDAEINSMLTFFQHELPPHQRNIFLISRRVVLGQSWPSYYQLSSTSLDHLA
jgi:hypothetical protein